MEQQLEDALNVITCLRVSESEAAQNVIRANQQRDAARTELERSCLREEQLRAQVTELKGQLRLVLNQNDMVVKRLDDATAQQQQTTSAWQKEVAMLRGEAILLKERVAVGEASSSSLQLTISELQARLAATSDVQQAVVQLESQVRDTDQKWFVELQQKEAELASLTAKHKLATEEIEELKHQMSFYRNEHRAVRDSLETLRSTHRDELLDRERLQLESATQLATCRHEKQELQAQLERERLTYADTNEAVKRLQAELQEANERLAQVTANLTAVTSQYHVEKQSHTAAAIQHQSAIADVEAQLRQQQLTIAQLRSEYEVHQNEAQRSVVRLTHENETLQSEISKLRQELAASRHVANESAQQQQQQSDPALLDEEEWQPALQLQSSPHKDTDMAVLESDHDNTDASEPHEIAPTPAIAHIEPAVAARPPSDHDSSEPHEMAPSTASAAPRDAFVRTSSPPRVPTLPLSSPSFRSHAQVDQQHRRLNQHKATLARLAQQDTESSSNPASSPQQALEPHATSAEILPRQRQRRAPSANDSVTLSAEDALQAAQMWSEYFDRHRDKYAQQSSPRSNSSQGQYSPRSESPVLSSHRRSPALAFSGVRRFAELKAGPQVPLSPDRHKVLYSSPRRYSIPRGSGHSLPWESPR